MSLLILFILIRPFNSNATYNVLFRENDSSESAAQIQAFDDTWHWNIDSERAYREVVQDGRRGYVGGGRWLAVRGLVALLVRDSRVRGNDGWGGGNDGEAGRNVIATLRGDMERENAEMALLITLEPPTAPMEQEAVTAGFYEPEAVTGTQFPRVQIATIEDILDGNGPQIPRLGLSEAPTFRRAPRRRRGGGVDPQRML